jgi:predicted ATPase
MYFSYVPIVYRDDHLKCTDLGRTFHQLRQDGRAQTVHDMTLTNLTEADVTALLSDKLGVVDIEAVKSLAHLCFSRTLGNPFFLTQFLGVLEQDGFFTFEVEVTRNRLVHLAIKTGWASRSCNIDAQSCFFSWL